MYIFCLQPCSRHEAPSELVHVRRHLFSHPKYDHQPSIICVNGLHRSRTCTSNIFCTAQPQFCLSPDNRSVITRGQTSKLTRRGGSTDRFYLLRVPLVGVSRQDRERSVFKSI